MNEEIFRKCTFDLLKINSERELYDLYRRRLREDKRKKREGKYEEDKKEKKVEIKSEKEVKRQTFIKFVKDFLDSCRQQYEIGKDGIVVNLSISDKKSAINFLDYLVKNNWFFEDQKHSKFSNVVLNKLNEFRKDGHLTLEEYNYYYTILSRVIGKYANLPIRMMQGRSCNDDDTKYFDQPQELSQELQQQVILNNGKEEIKKQEFIKVVKSFLDSGDQKYSISVDGTIILNTTTTDKQSFINLLDYFVKNLWFFENVAYKRFGNTVLDKLDEHKKSGSLTLDEYNYYYTILSDVIGKYRKGVYCSSRGDTNHDYKQQKELPQKLPQVKMQQVILRINFLLDTY
jgi:hypothetical protein